MDNKVQTIVVGMLEGGQFEGRLELHRRVYSPDGIAPALTTHNNDIPYGDGAKIIIYEGNKIKPMVKQEGR